MRLPIHHQIGYDHPALRDKALRDPVLGCLEHELQTNGGEVNADCSTKQLTLQVCAYDIGHTEHQRRDGRDGVAACSCVGRSEMDQSLVPDLAKTDRTDRSDAAYHWAQIIDCA